MIRKKVKEKRGRKYLIFLLRRVEDRIRTYTRGINQVDEAENPSSK